MRPLFGGVNPSIERINVVLPDPFEPSRQVILPGAAESDTFSSTLALS
jgi:hypothetical protein